MISSNIAMQTSLSAARVASSHYYHGSGSSTSPLSDPQTVNPILGAVILIVLSFALIALVVFILRPRR